MLSRVADALYWMSRYIERAEHASRVLLAVQDLHVELQDLDPPTAAEQWIGAATALGLTDPVTLHQAVFGTEETASVLSALSRARENARQVREVISSEMWERLNESFWRLREARTTVDAESSSPAGDAPLLVETLQKTVADALLFAGVSDATMERGDGFHFLKLGQQVERADRVARLVSARVFSRALDDEDTDSSNVVWIGLLASCGALEAYRKTRPTRMDPTGVVEFLVFEKTFPRTVRYSIDQAAESAKHFSDHGEGGRAVERAFGKLAARLDFGDIEDVRRVGACDFLAAVISDLTTASFEVQRAYFLH